MGLSPNIWVFFAFMFLVGFAVPAFSTPTMTVLQETVEPDRQGRVFGFFGIVGAVAMPLGMGMFGPLADVYSVELVLVAAGVATLVAAALALLLPAGQRAMRAARDQADPLARGTDRRRGDRAGGGFQPRRDLGLRTARECAEHDSRCARRLLGTDRLGPPRPPNPGDLVSTMDPAAEPIASAATAPPPSASSAPPVADPRRFRALAVIAVAQLMIVLDASIVNLAIPTAQADLGIAPADVQWIVTAYTLAFGGLLLLGGRIADYWGRRRTFIVGLLGFAAASLLGGIAPSGGLLIAARALQGGFGALLAPAALALITVTFHEPKERAKAFGVMGAISGGGAAIGLLLGGVLTEYLSWRWCLAVNTPIAIVTALLAVRFVRESRARGCHQL